MLLAAGSAYGLALLLAPNSPAEGWAAVLGAVLGVGAAALPLGWLMFKLAREVEPAAAGSGRASVGASAGRHPAPAVHGPGRS